MTAERSDPLETDSTSTDAGAAGASDAGPEATGHTQQAKTNTAARTRRLTGKAVAWARQNPRAAAGGMAGGAAALGLTTWRRITRRGEGR